MDIWGAGSFRALFLIPWVIPDVCTALLWKWLYADEFGVINFLLAKFGLISTPVTWLSNPDIAMPAVIIVQIWKLYPGDVHHPARRAAERAEGIVRSRRRSTAPTCTSASAM